jgi:hypothetical protein
MKKPPERRGSATEAAVRWAEKSAMTIQQKTLKATGKPSKKEDKKIDKITKHLSMNEKI